MDFAPPTAYQQTMHMDESAEASHDVSPRRAVSHAVRTPENDYAPREAELFAPVQCRQCLDVVSRCVLATHYQLKHPESALPGNVLSDEERRTLRRAAIEGRKITVPPEYEPEALPKHQIAAPGKRASSEDPVAEEPARVRVRVRVRRRKRARAASDPAASSTAPRVPVAARARTVEALNSYLTESSFVRDVDVLETHLSHNALAAAERAREKMLKRIEDTVTQLKAALDTSEDTSDRADWSTLRHRLAVHEAAGESLRGKDLGQWMDELSHKQKTRRRAAAVSSEALSALHYGQYIMW